MLRTMFLCLAKSTHLVRPTISNLPRLSYMRYLFTSTSDPTQVALLEYVEAKVMQVLKSAAKCDHKKLTRQATFAELGFDSLDSVELVVAMEEYFGIDIPNEYAYKILSVEAAINTFFRILNSYAANKLLKKDPSNDLPSPQ